MLVEVGKTTEIPEGEARRFEANGAEIAVANLGHGRFFALDDICSHGQASLSEGEVDVEEETVECPRHGSMFDLHTGEPQSLPATAPVSTFPVKIEGDRILIEMEE